MANEKYTFLPWLRKGLGRSITQTEDATPTTARPTITAEVKLNEQVISKQIMIQSAGDVVRLNSSTIVRTEPQSGITNFESNYLPYIEFFDEDLPWRYTPAMPGQDAENRQRLTPWFCLITLKSGEFTIDGTTPGKPKFVFSDNVRLPNGIVLPDQTPISDIMPPSDQLYAWAHVQVNKDYGSVEGVFSTIVNDIKADPNIAFSRMMCPRKLEDNLTYTCFLIPTYELGRLAGLGLENTEGVHFLQKAWDSEHCPKEFPFYYTWSFSTSLGGDFKEMTRLIEPRPVPPSTAGRPVFLGKTGMNIDTTMLNPNTVLLEGALRPPQTLDTCIINEPAFADYVAALSDRVNLSDQLTEESGEMDEDDLGVLPPIYGQWHAQKNRVEALSQDKPWLSQLNLDPKNRVAAAVGSQIVKENQEEFMEQAWEQVDDIMRANQLIRQAEVAARVGQVLFNKHIKHPAEPMNEATKSRLLSMTAGLHQTLRTSDSTGVPTFKKHFEDSRIPNGVLTTAFKKITRPGLRRNKMLSAMMDLPFEPLNKKMVDRMNQSATNSLEEYPLYLKKAVPADAIPLELITQTVNLFEAAIAPSAPQDANYFPQGSESSIEVDGSFTYDLNVFKSINEPMIENVEELPVADTSTYTWLAEGLSPMRTVQEKLRTNVQIWNGQSQQYESLSGLQALESSQAATAMPYPVIDTPVYELLKGISSDYIIPNLSDLPDNSATLMEVNNTFIEALFTGLNHEMSRELLWREFPTDQRGSYLRKFWDRTDSVVSAGNAAEQNDIASELHQWSGPLGSNISVGTDQIVLVIRGQLLQKFPDTLIFAVEAEFSGDPGSSQEELKSAPRQMKTSGQTIYPTFTAKLGTDVTLLGFDLTVNAALGKNEQGYTAANAGYFFALQERPGQLRFGLDEESPSAEISSWSELSWDYLTNPSMLDFWEYPILFNYNFDDVKWANSSCDVASVFWQKPTLILISALEMLNE